MTTEEKQTLKLGVEVLQRIRAQLEDFQTKFDMLFYQVKP
jgi:hypothetical protein